MKIITADERLAERGAPKILIGGRSGVGKTTLLKTLNPETTLFWDLEAGDLAVKNVPVDAVRARTWKECRDLACFLGGANPNLTEDKVYGEKHYAHVVSEFGDAGQLEKYATYFVDSVTVAARLCLVWAQQQPEAYNAQGAPNLLGAYGLLGREMISWVTQLQHAKTKNVVMVGVLEETIDDFKRSLWGLQIDGQKAAKEIPPIVDEVLALHMVTFEGDDEPTRVFLCSPEVGNEHVRGTFPLKDRSGVLDAYEPPDLGKLIRKLGGQA